MSAIATRQPPCPQCGARAVYRSHRRGLLERILSVIGLFPHRCDDCSSRFYAFRRA